MKNTIKTLLLLFSAVILQGCVGTLANFAIEGMNGAGACPIGEQQRAAERHYHVTTLPSGTPSQQVVQRIGQPVKQTKARLRGGQKISVWYYQTGHKKCRGMPTTEQYTPLVMTNNVVWGGGEGFLQQLQPQMVGREQLANSR